MGFADRLPPFARLAFLGKYQAQGQLVAAGFLAGFLLFLGWWAFQPAIGARVGVGATAAADAGATPAIGDRNGVLDGITGAPAPGRGQLQDPVAEDEAIAEGEGDGEGVEPEEGVSPDEVAVPGDEGTGDVADGVAPPPEQADDAMAMPASPDAVSVHPFYVEVERGPGVSEVLRVDATSPDQVLAILRDYRGDPKVLRGPSAQPLD